MRCVWPLLFFALSSIRERKARPDNSWHLVFSVKNVSCQAVKRSYFSGFFFFNRQRSCFILCWVDKGVLSVLLKSVSHGKALGVCPLKLQCFVFSVCDST